MKFDDRGYERQFYGPALLQAVDNNCIEGVDLLLIIKLIHRKLLHNPMSKGYRQRIY